MNFEIIFSLGLKSGVIWALMIIGVYITYRILDIADLGVEGTFPLGAAIVALLIGLGVPAIIATFVAMLGGVLFGIITGLLHTKLKIPAILSGIITLTGLYTINMMVMGKFTTTLSMLPINNPTIFTDVINWLYDNKNNVFVIIVSIILVVLVIGMILVGIRFIKRLIKFGFKHNLKKNIIDIVFLSIMGLIALVSLIIIVISLSGLYDFGIINNYLCDNKKLGISTLGTIIVSSIILLIVFMGCYWFFGTEIGMSLRATGNNPKMAKAQGINTNAMIILGLAISNGLVALCGAVFAQDYGSANVQQGQGVIVIGLAAIVIGESIFGKQDFKKSLISVIVGSILYMLLEAAATKFEVENYLKLVRAILIVIVLVIPFIKNKLKKKRPLTREVLNA